MEGKSGVNFCRNEGRASSEGLAPAAANEKKSSLVKVTVSTLENSANGEQAVNEGPDVDERRRNVSFDARN